MPPIFPAASPNEDEGGETSNLSGAGTTEAPSGVSSRSSPQLPLNGFAGKFAATTAGSTPPILYHSLPHIANHQMLDMQPDHYISRERTSNTRGPAGIDEQDALPIDPLLAAYPPILHRPGEPVLDTMGHPIRNINTVEAMEVNAARALEELALNRGSRVMGQPYPSEDDSANGQASGPFHTDGRPDSGQSRSGMRSRSERSHSAASPRPSDATPLSSSGSVVADDDADGSEEAQQDAAARGDDHLSSFSPGGLSATSQLPSSRSQRTSSRKQRSGAPIPVPFLTKPSRGRRVPVASAADTSTISALSAVAQEDMSDDEIRPTYGARGGAKKGGGTENAARMTASTRAYVCAVEGCGKAFRRGEHLKRHVRSLHTHEKPERCTFPGCGKEFSRKDNMMQHLKIHGHTHSRKEIPSTNIPIMTVEPTIHPAAHS